MVLSTFYYLAWGPAEPALPYFTRQSLHSKNGRLQRPVGRLRARSAARTRSGPRLSRYRPGLVNAGGAALWGVITIPLVICTSAAPATAMMLVSGAVWGPYLAVEASALQRWVPPARHGQFFGAQHALIAFATPVGAAVGSIALLRFTSAQVLGGVIVACSAAGFVGLASRSLRSAR